MLPETILEEKMKSLITAVEIQKNGNKKELDAVFLFLSKEGQQLLESATFRAVTKIKLQEFYFDQCWERAAKWHKLIFKTDIEPCESKFVNLRF